MNKNLIKGMTLLAVCTGFASCSKDLTPMTQEEIDNLQALKVTNTYEQAFLNYVGGSIAEDLDGALVMFTVQLKPVANHLLHAQVSLSHTMKLG